MGVRLFPAVHGHIADSVRDHGPGLGPHFGRIARDGEAEAGGSPNRWFLDFNGPPLREQTKITGFCTFGARIQFAAGITLADADAGVGKLSNLTLDLAWISPPQ